MELKTSRFWLIWQSVCFCLMGFGIGFSIGFNSQPEPKPELVRFTEPIEPEDYGIEVKCRNCNHSFTFNMPKGEKTEGKLIVCKHCQVVCKLTRLIGSFYCDP